jgi:hypothetical protein
MMCMPLLLLRTHYKHAENIATYSAIRMFHSFGIEFSLSLLNVGNGNTCAVCISYVQNLPHPIFACFPLTHCSCTLTSFHPSQGFEWCCRGKQTELILNRNRLNSRCYWNWFSELIYMFFKKRIKWTHNHDIVSICSSVSFMSEIAELT